LSLSKIPLASICKVKKIVNKECEEVLSVI